MNKFKILLMAVVTTFSINAYAQSTPAPIMDSIKLPEKVMYTCSMHPDIISDQPGICPKCGMELVKITNDQNDSKGMKMKKMHMMGMKGMGILMGVVMVTMMLIAGNH